MYPAVCTPSPFSIKLLQPVMSICRILLARLSIYHVSDVSAVPLMLILYSSDILLSISGFAIALRFLLPLRSRYFSFAEFGNSIVVRSGLLVT